VTPEDSAVLLRRAAADMRADTERATQGRWKLWGMQVLADQDGTSNVDTAIPVCHTYSVEYERLCTFNAAHIASWSPAVALAVADWLETVGHHLAFNSIGGHARASVLRATEVEQALAVAEAYLGGAS